ncbi:SRPBCC family protein [Coralloluteibacterium thermophilus]|uniref:SRPBCC family protein n=1 Tax=Coralloluteibacterium thermophilum TaxID=2707049 RepID=A0ABV9NNG2_9GAMM
MHSNRRQDAPGARNADIVRPSEDGTNAFEFQIEAPPERVFAAIGDIKRWRDWVPDIHNIEWLSRGMLGVGSRWLVRRQLDGDVVEQAFEVSEWEPGRELGLNMIGRRGEGIARRYTLRLLRGSAKDTTRVRVELACEDEPFPCPPVLSSSPERHRMLITSLEALKRHVEAG